MSNRAEIQDPRDHVGLVWLNAERMGRRFETEPGEFAGESYLSMVEAVRTWDHSKGCRFSTHAMPSLKFRTYKAVMYERGKRRRDVITAGGRERTWVDPLRSEKIYEDIPDRREMHDDTDARKMLDTVLEIAAEVSPWHGVESVRLMANGVDDEQIGRAIGQSWRYARWLRKEIKERIARGPRPVKRVVRPRKPLAPNATYAEVADRVCELFKVHPLELGDRHRREAVVSARMFLIHVMYAKGFKYQDIALKMKGTRQHSTIITAHQRLKAKLQTGETFEVWNAEAGCFERWGGERILGVLG